MTILQEDVDFLAHFGVKGQKWGIRRKKDTSPTPHKMSNKTKTVVAAASIAAGIFAAKAILKKSGNTRVAVLLPDGAFVNKLNETKYGFNPGRLVTLKAKDVPKLASDPFGDYIKSVRNL